MIKKNKYNLSKFKDTPKSDWMFGKIAENLFCTVYGKKYISTEIKFQNDSQYFKKEIIKIINKFIEKVSKLIAPEQFVDDINYQLGYFKKEIKSKKQISGDSKGFIVISLKIIAALLGYHCLAGNKYNEPYYIPNLWAQMKGWDNLKEYLDTTEYLTKQKKIEIIKALIKDGNTHTEISMILNISSYKVAQLIKEANHDQK